MFLNKSKKVGGFHLTPIAFAVLCASTSGSAIAQQNDDETQAVPTGLEVIEVTSTKRVTSVMETGQAINAFNKDSMEDLGIEGAQDLVQYSPSLIITNNRVSIRGVGRPNTALGSDPGVGIYTDGVYNTENGIFDYCNFCDVERVEVLRGPQGTLYGRNSVGGAINLISTQPEQDFGGYVNVEFGNDGYQVQQAQLTGPLGEMFSGIVTVSKKQRDGLQENQAEGGKDFDDTDRTYYSGTLKADWTDNWSSSIRYMNHDRDEIGSPGYLKDEYTTDFVNASPINFPGIFPGATAFNHLAGYTKENPGASDISKTDVDTTGHLKSEAERIIFVNEISFGDLDLKYTFGDYDYDYDSLKDGDVANKAYGALDLSMMLAQLGIPYLPDPTTGAPITLASDMTTSIIQSGESTSHELQLVSNYESDLNFIAGLYYYNSEESQYNDFVERGFGLMQGDAIQAYYGGAIDTGFVSGIVPAPGILPLSVYQLYSVFLGGAPFEATEDGSGGYLYYTQNDLETTSKAVYGQVEYNLTDDLKLTTGLRYSEDEKEGMDEVFAYLALDKTEHKVDDTWDKVTWRVQADWTIDDNSFLYGYVATGYRSGGFNLGSPTLDEPDVVEPEELTAYEVGYKRSLFDNSMNLTAAAYYYDYTDLQVVSTVIEGGRPITAFDNAAEASVTGLELGLQALVTDDLELNATYSYNKSEYDKYSAVDSTACTILGECDIQDLSGNELNMAPETKFSLTAIQYVELESSGLLTFSAGYSYVGEQYSRAFNRNDWDKVDSYDNIDGRISWTSPEATYVIAAFVKNAGDDRDVLRYSAPSPDTRMQAAELSDPMSYGLQLRYNFN